jgi:hexosaminidase
MINITRAPRDAGRFLLLAIASLFASITPLHAQPTLKLIPTPREVHAGKLLSLDHGIVVRAASRDAEDRFTAEDLRASLKERGIPIRASGPVV